MTIKPERSNATPSPRTSAPTGSARMLTATCWCAATKPRPGRHPDAVAWFTGKDLAEPPAAEVPKIENAAKNDAGAEARAEELEAAKGEVAEVDPDGDGKVGGSRKKAAKK